MLRNVVRKPNDHRTRQYVPCGGNAVTAYLFPRINAFEGELVSCRRITVSTVAQEVENPRRNYPLAMLATCGIVALSYVSAQCHRCGRYPGRSVHNRLVDRCGAPACRTMAGDRRRHRRHHQRRGHVQCAHPLLYPAAGSDGGGPHDAFRTGAAQPPAQPLGSHSAVRPRLGTGARIHLRAAHLHRSDLVWRQPRARSLQRSSRCASSNRRWCSPFVFPVAWSACGWLASVRWRCSCTPLTHPGPNR